MTVIIVVLAVVAGFALLAGISNQNARRPKQQAPRAPAQQTSDPPTTTTKWYERDDVRIIAGIIILHMLIASVPGLYRFFAKQPVFWVIHAVLLWIAFTANDSRPGWVLARKVMLWASGIALAISILVTLVKKPSNSASQTPAVVENAYGQTTIVVTREWSEPVRINPSKEDLNWYPHTDSVTYQVRAYNGKIHKIHTYSRFGQRQIIEGPVNQVQFRVTDERVDSLGMNLTVSPLGNQPGTGRRYGVDLGVRAGVTVQ